MLMKVYAELSYSENRRHGWTIDETNIAVSESIGFAKRTAR